MRRLLFWLMLAVGVCKGAEMVKIGGAYAPPSAPGAKNGAVFLRLENLGVRDEVLLGARSGVSGAVELHTTIEKNGMLTMQPTHSLIIPARGSLELRHGGAHIMLIGLKSPLAEGESFPLTLIFQSGEQTISVPITKHAH